ncbi:MAG: hypothetical protein ABII09_08390 [Planctomycetota bacterium]
MTIDAEHKWGKGIAARTREKLLRLPLWRQVLLALVLAAMVMVAGVMLAAYVAGKRLSSEVIKISKAGEPLVYADLRPEPAKPGAGEDAALYYVEAVRRIRPGDLQDLVKLNIFYRLNMVSLPTDKFPAELREKTAQSLAKAESVFEMLDKGAKLPLSEFDTGVLRGRQICKDRLDSIQGTVFLSSLRTLNLIQAGKVDKAAESAATTLKLMRAFDTFPTIPVQGRKMICVRLMCSDIQMLLIYASKEPSAGGRLSEKQLERLQSLLDESFDSNTLEKTLLAERVYQLEVGRNLIPRRVASRLLSPDVPSLPDRLAKPQFRWHRMRICFGAARFLRDMAWFIEVSRLPWPGPLNEIKDANSTPSKGASGLISTVAPLTRLIAETLVAKECLTTIVAIERYRRQEKALPDTLKDIYPQYIKSIPLDPFTGRSVLYTHNDKSYKVFSAANIRIDDVNSIVPAR